MSTEAAFPDPQSGRKPQKTPVSRPGLLRVGKGGQGPPDDLQTRFENRGRLETDGLGGSDFHGFSGLRVAALARSTFFDLKSSESNDLDFGVFLHTVGDGRKDGFEGFIGRAFGGVFSEGDLDGINQVRFVHGRNDFDNSAGAWQEKSS